MNPKISAVFLGLITLACFAAGGLLYPHLANAFALPLIILALDLVWGALPTLGSIRKALTGFRHVYDFFTILIVAFLALVYALTLHGDLGSGFGHLLFPALGILFAILGASVVISVVYSLILYRRESGR